MRADEDCVAVEAKDEEEGAVDVDDEVPLPGGLNGSRNTALLSPPPLALLVVLSEDITTTGWMFVRVPLRDHGAAAAAAGGKRRDTGGEAKAERTQSSTTETTHQLPLTLP